MGISEKIADFMNGVFEESEEEIKEEIKEAKKQLAESEKRLKELKKRKKKKDKFFKARHVNIAFLTILILLILVISFSFYSGYSSTFRYVCEEKNGCEDCDVAASCIQFEERGSNNHLVHFEVENRNSLKGKCYAHVYFDKDSTNIDKKIISLGSLLPGETKRFVYETSLPNGETDVSVEPFCEWLDS